MRKFTLFVSLLWFFSFSCAVAQTNPPSPQSPTYEQVFAVIVGLLITMIGVYARGIERRVSALESSNANEARRLNELREMVIGNHYRKHEIDERLDKIESLISSARSESSSQLGALHSRLDLLQVPRAR